MQKNKTFITTLPDLIEIQKKSFCWFIKQGIFQEFNNFSSVLDFTHKKELCLFGNELTLKMPIFNAIESRDQEITYSAKIYIPIEVRCKEQDILPNKKKILIGLLPLMTDSATFIINGCERVIISQIVRSPGIFFKKDKKLNKFTATLIADRGSWLNFEFGDEDTHIKQTIINSNFPTGIEYAYNIQNSNLKGSFNSKKSIRNIIIRTDKYNKITVTKLLNLMGFNNTLIFNIFKQANFFIHTLIADSFYSDLNIEDNIQTDLSYYFDKYVTNLDPINSNRNLDSDISKIFDSQCYDIGRVGRIKINQRLKLNISEEIQTVTYDDIISIIDYLFYLNKQKVSDDDIDHLQNRRVRSVGELIKNQVRIGLRRFERSAQEKFMKYINYYSFDNTTLNTHLNTKPLTSTLREFFGSSQLSQFLDQTNPLSELTHKRRISSLGPGGLNKDHISFAVRDIHPSHYGRICPIETPEGKNAGLVSSLTTYAKINSYGFIETPFWKVKKGKICINQDPVYLTADVEDCFNIASADTEITTNGLLKQSMIPVRYRQDYYTVSRDNVDFVAVSPVQIVSIAAALIPFFEHDDANRALMGSNMQRQAVPLIFPKPPIVGTGFENQIAIDSGVVITAFKKGIVTYVSSKNIYVLEKNGKNRKYTLQHYKKSNQNISMSHRPIVWVGETVESGQILADGPGINSGELSLGQNLIVAYMPWQGYNFEDAILINERLVYENIFTSLHIKKYEVHVKKTLLGPEKTIKDLPYVNINSTKNLDENGIIKKGVFVKPNDILVGKIAPRDELDLSPVENILQAIFYEKNKNVYDTSVKALNGEYGRVLDVKLINKNGPAVLPPDTVSIIRIFLAQSKKIQVGDKISGRHGNKGIISLILPREDMPYLPDGTPIDVILNPLGVPSRMNVGQLYECLLGLAGSKLNRRFKILPFDEMYGQDTSRILINKKLRQASIENNEAWIFNPYSPGKIVLIDGRTGNTFENPVTVGKAYMLKLIHLVDYKIHARSTGPYSLVTQQPLGGKSRNGGQRFGEMEVWALEAFGAAYTLQELLTLKSDDMKGRYDLSNSIIKGRIMPQPGIPESFKVLMNELRAIGLDISTNKIKNTKDYINEVNLMEDSVINLLNSFSKVSTF